MYCSRLKNQDPMPVRVDAAPGAGQTPGLGAPCARRANEATLRRAISLRRRSLMSKTLLPIARVAAALAAA
jgi:hypothetical protein